MVSSNEENMFIVAQLLHRTEHWLWDVHANPVVALLRDDLPWQAGAAPEVQQQGWLVGWQAQQLQRTHAAPALHLYNPGAVKERG